MAKKAAAKKKSNEPKPAAKKAAGGGKKKATKKASSGSAITQQDMAQVYARAWVDEAFRTLLETDPTAALQQYAAENGLEWTKLVPIPAPPSEGDESCIHLVSCC